MVSVGRTWMGTTPKSQNSHVHKKQRRDSEDIVYSEETLISRVMKVRHSL